MRCEDCESITNHIFAQTTFWFDLPTQDSFAKLAAWCGTNDLTARQFSSNGVAVTAKRDQVDGFITSIFDLFSRVERIGTQIVTSDGRSPCENDIGRVMNFEVFANRYKANWLVHSIEKDNFESWFQPIVVPCGDHFEIHGQEALFRLKDDEGAIIPPAHVFEVASHSDLLFSVDLVARRSAVESAARAGLTSKLFINFNPSSIYDPSYCLRSTAAAIQELGLQADQIVFEVVETHAATDLEHLRGILSFYRNAGFKVALDDMGAGWSGLNMLNALRPNYVKIDMELIRDIHDDPYKQEIVRQLVTTAQRTEVKTIAEGIETAEELACLLAIGADFYQGYYFGKPEPLSQSHSAIDEATLAEAIKPLQRASNL